MLTQHFEAKIFARRKAAAELQALCGLACLYHCTAAEPVLAVARIVKDFMLSHEKICKLSHSKKSPAANWPASVLCEAFLGLHVFGFFFRTFFPAAVGIRGLPTSCLSPKAYGLLRPERQSARPRCFRVSSIPQLFFQLLFRHGFFS